MKKIFKIVILVSFAIFPMGGVFSGDASVFDQERIQSLFNKAVEKSGVVGAQLSLIKGGQQLDFVYGLANAELGIDLTQDAIIQIGSTTKIFNAMVVLTLVDQGILDLDVPVKKYIPEFEISDDAAARVITLRHLLSMSSGLDNGPYTRHGVGEEALAKYVASLKNIPVHFKPGSGFGYSNAGTSIAGYVAERVSGKSWDDLLMDNILKPAGLNNAATLERDLLFQRVSVGHRVGAKGEALVVRPWHLTRAQGPAGSTLAMSAHDLARFGEIFLNNGVADNGIRILSEASINQMMTPQVDLPTKSLATAWGVGPHMANWNGGKVWGHPGGNMSGVSYLFWLPEQKGVIAFVLNTPAALGAFSTVMFQEATKEVFGVSKPVLTAPKEAKIIKNIQRFVGKYSGVSVTYVVEKLSEKHLSLKTMSGGQTKSQILIPVGGDRFLLAQKDGDKPLIVSGNDVAFFGNDKEGRATALLPGPFAYSRDE